MMPVYLEMVEFFLHKCFKGLTSSLGELLVLGSAWNKTRSLPSKEQPAQVMAPELEVCKKCCGETTCPGRLHRVISMCMFFCQPERNRGSLVGRGVGSCKGTMAGVTWDEARGATARGKPLGSPFKAVGGELLGFLSEGGGGVVVTCLFLNDP